MVKELVKLPNSGAHLYQYYLDFNEPLIRAENIKKLCLKKGLQ